MNKFITEVKEEIINLCKNCNEILDKKVISPLCVDCEIAIEED